MSDADPRLSALRLVEWWLEGDEQPQRALVPTDDAERLVAALRTLHGPGATNPHSGRPTATLLRASIGAPALKRGDWWTSPSLKDDDSRARVVSWTRDYVYDVLPADDPPDPV